jgi:hypothetical protein
MPTDDTARVARAYHDAWTNRKGPEALRELMGEEFVFDSDMMHIEGREQFLAEADGQPAMNAMKAVQSTTTSLETSCPSRTMRWSAILTSLPPLLAV